MSINNEVAGLINNGLLLFAGIEEADTEADADWLAGKVVNMRIFADAEGKMNRSVLEAGGGILVVSQCGPAV